jgi:2-isopropylmalate synthase
VRVNSQSGKGGVAFSLERDYGLQLPRALQVEFSQHVQKHSEAIDDEVSGTAIQDLFTARYVNRSTPWQLQRYQIRTHDDAQVSLQVELHDSSNSAVTLTGAGNGALAAAVAALHGIAPAVIEIVDYHEHALQQGTAAKAACYVHIDMGGKRCWGVGIAEDSMRAALMALLSAVNSDAHREQVAA